VKIDKGQQKIKIVHTNRQSNLRVSCQSIFSLSRHHPRQFSQHIKAQQKIKIVRTNRQSNLQASCQSIGEWRENQILISDWTYFHCPGTTLPTDNQICGLPANQFSRSAGTTLIEENKISFLRARVAARLSILGFLARSVWQRFTR